MPVTPTLAALSLTLLGLAPIILQRNDVVRWRWRCRHFLRDASPLQQGQHGFLGPQPPHALGLGGTVGQPGAGAVTAEVGHVDVVVPEHVLHVALHLAKGAQDGAVAGVVPLQGLQAGVGGIHVVGVGAALQQGIHEGVDKVVVELGEVGLGQAGDEHRKAGGVVHHEHALAALQGEQVGVPAGQGAGGHGAAQCEPGGALAGRELAVGIKRQFGAQLLGGVEVQHGGVRGDWGRVTAK